ncbi:MAG: flagellar export chaperone FliS [Thermodesulfitimonas sp.]
MAKKSAAQNEYFAAAIATAPPGRLLLMLYDGAINFLSRAVDALERKDFEEANRLIVRAQDIIAELTSSLDMRYDVAQSLYQLYDYFNRRLVEANVKKDGIPIAEVQGYLRELRAVWAEVIAAVGAGAAVPPSAAGMEV